ncbi:MFS transporter [Jeongeupia naejangsanensis]|uniref:MFS transporter n=1 Tax=Jeongeupia naejangsanensis TaxID=613195 RepID=A0ABS2BFJ3_9NEIS|nr:MFS transporter [Jeongeupia naejangsanensis]MBM3114220.1 MFS transporter [Jeongeupia naejangsanensis]
MKAESPAGGVAVIGGFYFCYFAFNGLFSPYWGLYLAALALPAWQIGILTSLTQVNRIYAPAIWGWLADRSCRRRAILRLAGVAGLAGFLSLLVVDTFWPMFLAVLFASFFWSAALPLVESLAIGRLAGDSGRYARLRVWGSIGFIAASLGAGYWIEASGVKVFPLAVVGTMAGLAVYCWRLPESPVRAVAAELSAGFGDILRRREVRVFLVGCFLMSLAHGPYYSFYSIHLAEHGLAQSTIGWLWTVGVLAEVGLFLAMPLLNRRFSPKALFVGDFAIAVVRFLLIAFGAHSLPLLAVAQLGHAFTFACHHAVAMGYLHRHFAGAHAAKGQALYIAASFGIGGSLGGVIAGFLWADFSGATVFALAAGVSALGGVLCAFGLPGQRKIAMTGR